MGSLTSISTRVKFWTWKIDSSYRVHHGPVFYSICHPDWFHLRNKDSIFIVVSVFCFWAKVVAMWLYEWTCHGSSQLLKLEFTIIGLWSPIKNPQRKEGASLVAQLVKNLPAVQQFNSVTQSCLTLCDPMNHSMPGCRRPWFSSWAGKICWRRDRLPTPVFLGFLCGPAGKESAYNVGDLGLIPGLGRSSGEGKGYPLQYSGPENSMDYIVLGVAKSWTTTEWLSLSEEGIGSVKQNFKKSHAKH